MAGSARADRPEGGFTASVDLHGGYLRDPPSLPNLRTPGNLFFTGLDGHSVHYAPGILVGLAFHVGYTPVKTPLVTFPILGFRVSVVAAPTSHTTFVDPSSGQTALLRLPDRSHLEILLPGVGLSQNFGRSFKLAALAQPAHQLLRLAWNADARASRPSTLKAGGGGIGVAGDASFCARVGDPKSDKSYWGCPFFSPMLITSNPGRPFTSFTFGLRIEFNGH